MGALEWEWGMLGSQMCAHARGVQVHNPCTRVCVHVPALRMETQSHQSAGVQVCTLRPCCTCVPAPCTCVYVRVCVYLLHAHLCAQVCPIHAHFCVSVYLVL